MLLRVGWLPQGWSTVAAATALYSFTWIAADQEPKCPTPEDALERILEWLPTDTETLFVARGSFEIGPLAEYFDSDVVPVAAGAQAFAVGSLLLREEYGRDSIWTRRVRLAVHGSRRFRSPKGLGSTTFEGASVVMFEEPLADAGDRLLLEIAEAGGRVEQVQGHHAVVLEHEYESDLWAMWFVQPRSDLLITATDRGYLAEVLRRIQGGGTGRALPDDLSEWRYIERDRPFWALRHYDPGQAPLDPTSPLHGRPTANVPDPCAVGFVFAGSEEPDGDLTFFYLSSSRDPVQIAAAGWSDEPETWTADAFEIGPGVVEVVIRTLDAESAWSFWWMLSARLGQAVFL